MMESKEDNVGNLSPGDESGKMNTGDNSPTKVSAERADAAIFRSDYQDSPLSKSMDFVFETKYVMLNFMSLVPPEMYSGHISSSLESASPDRISPNSPHMRHISKSKSFDIGLHTRRPRLKHIGRLRSRHMDIDSPASEDNVTNRYHWHRLDSPDEPRFDSDPGSQQVPWDLPFDNSNVQNVSASQLSPRKSMYLPRAQSSIVSSSGDLSYMSDADDEGDDLSNASSIFSSQSLHNRDGFLDLRRNVHIMPPLPSQSEEVDGVDGEIIDDGKAKSDTQTSEDGSTNRVVDECDSAVEQEAMATGGEEFAQCCRRPLADRTKLKLNIPCEPLQLDDILLSLQTELSSEIDDLESEFEEALKSARGSVTPLTPQSEAARVLARIGDEVNVQYGSQLSAAVSRLTYEQVNNLTYDQFRDIALTMVDRELPGWTQVALLMVFGQKVVWNAVQNGHKQFGGIIDFCSQLVADVAADFIIKQGGWCSVMNFDPSQSSDTLSSAELDTSNDMHDFFSSHNVTQVDSHEIAAAESDGKQTLKAVRSDKNEDTNEADLVKLLEIANANGKDTNLVHNGSHPDTDSEEHDIEHMRCDDDDDGEIFTAEKERSDDTEGGKAGITNKATGTVDRTVNKARYASSVGFEMDESGENIDINAECEGDTSLVYLQSLPDDNDRSVDEVEDMVADIASASEDISNGNPNIFNLDGSQKDNVAQSDIASLKLDLNGSMGDSIGHYDKESVYIKQATPIMTSCFDSAVVSEQNFINNPCNKTNDTSRVQAENLDIEDVIVEQEGPDNEGSKTVDDKPGEIGDDINFNKVKNEKYSNIPSELPCVDMTPLPITEEYSDNDLNVSDRVKSQIQRDMTDDSTSTYQRKGTHNDNGESIRETTQGELSSNQRETTHDELTSNQREKTQDVLSSNHSETTQDELTSNQRETTSEHSSDQSQAANGSSNHFHHHISSRGVQVSVITIAALAVAICVKIISR